jgi:hypothetical protein
LDYISKGICQPFPDQENDSEIHRLPQKTNLHFPSFQPKFFFFTISDFTSPPLQSQRRTEYPKREVESGSQRQLQHRRNSIKPQLEFQNSAENTTRATTEFEFKTQTSARRFIRFHFLFTHSQQSERLTLLMNCLR